MRRATSARSVFAMITVLASIGAALATPPGAQAAGPDDLVPVVVLMEEFPDLPTLLDEVRGMNRAQRP